MFQQLDVSMKSISFTYLELQNLALEYGFPLFGIVDAQNAPRFDQFSAWLDRGYAGEMDYLTHRKEAYQHPRSVLASVRSLIMLGMPYSPAASQRKIAKPRSIVSNSFGEVAAYASGRRDYHDVIHAKLKKMIHVLRSKEPDIEARGIVDSAPLHERDFAQLAGLGWIGKNTLLLNRSHGSYFFLASILVNADLPRSETPSPSVDHCGTCTACLDACPTKAFAQPYVLDATRCISYLTIEYRGTIPEELAGNMSNHVFGCDVCQQVCPWNRMAQPALEAELEKTDENGLLDLIQLLRMDDLAFRERFRKTPMWRSKREGMIRNAMITLANQRCVDAIPAIRALVTSPNAILRDTASWAIDKLTSAKDAAD
jgi:epoxyqueuosine reductase